MKKLTEEEKKHLKALMDIKAIIASGWAGVTGKGGIVDRRIHPEAIPLQENKLMGTPKPK